MAYPGCEGVVVKVNSYEHDEYGITTEKQETITRMCNKRLRKKNLLLKRIESYSPIKIYGNPSSETAILCYGSNKGTCVEVAQKLGLKVIQPVVLSPFPGNVFKKYREDIKRIIVVENNTTAQLSSFIKRYGFRADNIILKYDGRPFSYEELEKDIKELI